LQQARPAERADLRPEVVNFLIENALVDQYLDQMKVNIEPKELDVQVEKAKARSRTFYKDLDNFYKLLYLTEADLRAQVWQAMRWEKFINQYVTDKQVKEFYDANKAMFDGSQMRAKHILIAVKAGDAAAAEQAKAKIARPQEGHRRQGRQRTGRGGQAGQPGAAKKKMKLLEDAFAEAGVPGIGLSLEGQRRRIGVVRPHRRSRRRAVRPGDLQAQALGNERPGADGVWLSPDPGGRCQGGRGAAVRDLKDIVQGVYADRMRQLILQQMKPAAKIVVNPAPK